MPQPIANRLARTARIGLLVLTTALAAGSGAAWGQSSAPQIASGPMDISGADPSVIQTADGYVSVESRGGRRIMVRVAPDLAGLATAKPQRIWSDPEQLGAVWAPEILFRNGQYEVYFTAGVDEFHRMYVIKSDQPAADYGEATEIVLPDDKWAIDGLPFTYQGADYFIWSGWQGDTDVQQDLFIAAMNEDDEIISPRAAIATPDDAWENIAGETPSINEGPQPILDPAGQLHIVYSANGSWGENYCLSDLRLIVGGDPLVAEDWRESNGCLFGANPATLADGGTLAEEAKGVGHHSFVLPDGALEQPADPSQPIAFIYHGVPAAQEPANFWEAREWYVGSAQWVPDIVYGSGQLGDTGWSLKFSE